jgi:hypothetical protein
MNFDQMSESLSNQTTRRTVVKTGVKLAYAAPLVAATMKLSAQGVFAAQSGGLTFCGHSTCAGPDGVILNTCGCMQACAAAGGTGNTCNDICGDGQHTGLCPVGQGGNNPCCSLDLCDPANFTCTDKNHCVYTGTPCTP